MASSAGSSIGLGTLLTVIFVVLKLTDNIDWSWVWVLSPIWISWSLVLVIFGIIALGAFLSKR